VDSFDRTTLWRQFGAAIDTLENAIVACPEDLWGDRSRFPEYWYVASHTLFWLDHYLASSPEGFHPPVPFGLEELDPAGVMPPRVYTKPELLAYLEHGRERCRASIAALTDEVARRPYRFGSLDLSVGELYLYNMRHVQHHAAQLNLILRQTQNDVPGWVGKTRNPL